MNFLRLADGVSGLLPKKIKVQLLHHSTREQLLATSVSEELLPAVFNKPTLIEIKGQIWRVIKADLLREASYLFSKKIRLFVADPAAFDFGGKFIAPTLASGIPSGDFSDHSASVTEVIEAEWRQLEFLPVSLLPLIQEELLKIDAVLSPANETDCLLGYDSIYRRSDVLDKALRIPFDEFVKDVEAEQQGPLRIAKGSVVTNSFTLESPFYKYYGICEEGLIRELSVFAFESADDEFMRIIEKYELVFADWVGARLYAQTPSDAPEQDIVKLF